MGQGSVGPGSQNSWKDTVRIYERNPDEWGEKFTKRAPTTPVSRNDSICWTADTPVTWEGDDVSTARASVATVDGIPDMLVTLKDPDKPIDASNIDEYHPLITFFNEVMARLMDAPGGLKNKISNLKNKQNAIDVWNYLKKEYLD